MELELAREEFILVKSVLERYISDLRVEIARSGNGWRRELVVDEEFAKGVLRRLERPRATPDGQGRVNIVVHGYVSNGG